ncbi:unnamed protein product, partial [Rhizoctonia solani]
MPRTLAGDAQNNMDACDPRCTLENHKDQLVSKRVRKACTRRLNDLKRRQMNARHSEQPGLSSRERGLPEPQVPVFDFSGYIMRSLASAARPPPENNDSPEDMDITMPTWGLSTDVDAGGISGDSDDDEGLSHDMDGNQTPTLSLRMLSPPFIFLALLPTTMLRTRMVLLMLVRRFSTTREPREQTIGLHI